MTEFLSVYVGVPLPASGKNAAARDSALQAALAVDVEPTSLVGYRSAGYVLVVGPEEGALAAAASLQKHLRVTVVVTADAATLSAELAAVRDDPAVVVLRGSLASLQGHLGHFVAHLQPAQGEALNISELNDSGHPYFDLVVDLQPEAAIGFEVPPFGYYPVGDDDPRLQRALDEIPEMTGEFEKPKFFNYNPDICAHGDSGLTGCTRCLDACPTGAIGSIGDAIEVDPYLCQGGGSCTSVCPTGAIIYAYPGPRDQIARVKAMLAAYREAGGERPILLFHDEEAGVERLRRIAAELPDRVIPVRVAEVGAAGMDLWFSAFAYGAEQVVLLDTEQLAPMVRRAMREQISYAQPLLAGMGYGADALRWLDDAADAHAALADSDGLGVTPATFDTFNEKRGTLRLAIDHLFEHAPEQQHNVGLPSGAPFGQVLVNEDACTLCMSCPQVCPTRALTDAGDKPQLRFVEDLCVQCGLCQTACPEDAIQLEPRFLYDREERRQLRVLNEEEPFRCISCGKPFATPSVINRMTERLGSHHMFQGDEALRRLKMCGDCRVVDLFKDDFEAGSKPKWYGPQ